MSEVKKDTNKSKLVVSISGFDYWNYLVVDF